jgi:hypothetical protein
MSTRRVVGFIVVCGTLWTATASASVNLKLCSPSGMPSTTPAQKQACTDACNATVFDDTFVKNARACVPPIGGAAVTPIAPEPLPWISIITDFFVTRLKGEVTLFLKDRIADQLCPDSDKAVTTRLLPATCGALKSGDDAIATLPNAFRTDLDNLPGNLFSYAIELAKQSNQVLTGVLCVAPVMPGAYSALRSSGPLKALSYLAQVPIPQDSCKAFISDVRDTAAQVLQMLTAINCPPASGPPSSGGTGSNAAPQNCLAPLDLADAVDLSVKSVLVTKASGLGGAAAAASLADRWAQIRPLLSELASLIRDLRAGDHSPETVQRAADLTMTIIADAVDVDDNTRADMQTLANSIAALATKQYLKGALGLFSVKAIGDFFSKNKTTKDVWAQVSKWASLLGELAAAKTSADAQAILEAAAAPLGSYREFTKPGLKGFISGWAGVNGGVDFVSGEGNRASAFGLFLPVGFELGGPVAGGPSSLHLLVSIIDIGALATARFDSNAKSSNMGADGDYKLDPKQSFTAVFAPGAFLSVGIKDWPFVVGFGGELLPANIERFSCPMGVAVCETTVNVPTFRLMAVLAMDLTAFRVF